MTDPRIVRVVYVDDAGGTHIARTLGFPNYDDQPTRILVGLHGRITVVEAKYSQGREPGTWSRLAEPAG